MNGPRTRASELPPAAQCGGQETLTRVQGFNQSASMLATYRPFVILPIELSLVLTMGGSDQIIREPARKAGASRVPTRASSQLDVRGSTAGR